MAKINPLITAVRRDSLSRLKLLLPRSLEKGVDPGPALALAAELGRAHLVSMLSPHCSKEVCDKALAWAASHNWASCVEVLVRKCSSNGRAEALKTAAMFECLDVVLVLIPHNCRRHCSTALSHAAEYGSIEAVKALLAKADPSAKGSMALYYAAIYDRGPVVTLLSPLSNISQAANRLLLVKSAQVDLLANWMSEEMLLRVDRRMPGQLPQVRARLECLEMERSTPAAHGISHTYRL